MTSPRSIAIPLLAACGLCCALVGNAQAERYHVSMGGGTSALPSESIDALSSSKSYARVDLEAGIQLQHLPILRTTEIALSWSTGGLSGSSFGRIDSDLSLDTVMLVGRVRRDIRPRLSGFGEFGVGTQWARLQLNDAGSLARKLKDSDKAAASTIGVGVDFQVTNPGSPINVGLRAKVNYRVIDSHDFRATPMNDGSDELLLSTSSAALGSVNTSGMAFGAALVGRF